MHVSKNSRHTDATPTSAELERRIPGTLFVGVTMLLLLLPLVLMPFVHEDASREKRDLAPVPSLTVDGGVNLGLLADAGAYFEDHFAFRTQLVDANARLREGLFLTSAAANVVTGTDGWLYYANELDDFHRITLREAALRNAARNLWLVQQGLEARGKNFVLIVAPNKSTIHPEHMPYYEAQGTGKTNLDYLYALLDEYGVHYVDVRDGLAGVDPLLYFERDSHWNERGSLVAYEALCSSLGRTAIDFEAGETAPQDHEGDLDGMLHPLSLVPEQQEHHTLLDSYTVVNEDVVESVESPYIVCSSTLKGAQGNLLMYRDSFGNNLLAPMAATYGQSVFYWAVPYNMDDSLVAFADDVVIERAERHLATFAADPPYLSAPVRKVHVTGENEDGATTVFVKEESPYLTVGGSLGTELSSANDHVYVEVESPGGKRSVYEAYCVSQKSDAADDFEGQSQESTSSVEGDKGFRAYIAWDQNKGIEGVRVRVLVGTEDSCLAIASANV